MASATKRTKLECENRAFNNDWTLKYLFILPILPKSKPMCLLCNECVSAVKEYNVKRHFTTKHEDFGKSYPEGSTARKSKIDSLVTSYKRGSAILVRACSQQEKATAASLSVSWILAKKKRPFTDSETVKECILAVLDEIASDDESVPRGGLVGLHCHGNEIFWDVNESMDTGTIMTKSCTECHLV